MINAYSLALELVGGLVAVHAAYVITRRARPPRIRPLPVSWLRSTRSAGRVAPPAFTRTAR